MGVGEDIAANAIRVSLGWTTTASGRGSIYRGLEQHLRPRAGAPGTSAPAAVAAARLERCRKGDRMNDFAGFHDAARRAAPTASAPIYLDYQATTPTDPRVVEAMLPYFTEMFGNPHSRNHRYGWDAEEARREGAGAGRAASSAPNEKEIIFTSGATESNNLAIKGVARFYKDKKRHIVTCVTEHKCVLDSCRHLELDGFEVTYLPVQQERPDRSRPAARRRSPTTRCWSRSWR